MVDAPRRRVVSPGVDGPGPSGTVVDAEYGQADREFRGAGRGGWTRRTPRRWSGASSEGKDRVREPGARVSREPSTGKPGNASASWPTATCRSRSWTEGAPEEGGDRSRPLDRPAASRPRGRTRTRTLRGKPVDGACGVPRWGARPVNLTGGKAVRGIRRRRGRDGDEDDLRGATAGLPISGLGDDVDRVAVPAAGAGPLGRPRREGGRASPSPFACPSRAKLRPEI